MRRVIVGIVAIVLGAATTLALGYYALTIADRSSSSASSMFVRDGTELWLVRRLTSFGLEWINCEMVWPPLVNPLPDQIDLPSWAIPPERPPLADAVPRFATLAVGWPAPFVLRQWETTSPTQIFPLPVELDDGQDSLRRAAGRFIESDPLRPRPILWRGAIIDTGFFALAWLALLWGTATLLRSLHRKERDDPADQDEQRGRESGHAQQHLDGHSKDR